MPRLAPNAPFDNWPAHLSVAPYGPDRPERLLLWWDPSQRVLVTSIQSEVLDLPMARALVYGVDSCIASLSEQIQHAGGYAIHDWRRVKTFELEARKYQQERAKRNLADVNVHDQVIAIDVHPILHMALSVLSMVVSLTTGAPLRLVKPHDLEREVERRGVRFGSSDPAIAALQSRLSAVDYVSTDPTPL